MALVVYILKESFTQPGLDRFEGKYEELGFYRNENNTGPVLRIYAIKVLNEEGDWMREFAEMQPHTKYGKTLVYFFSPEAPSKIELTPKYPYFQANLEPLVLASFEKSPMGQSKFQEGFSQ
ncbi:MAG TPA: hypothetical protein DEQ87_06580 [Algoriphagus sp.]|nr:hypothetical protein [Algoriphagus sp.]MAN87533.1 hypothetical protein [Algoriphagus sp.]HAD50318.1 hypothetical protein [Algoriphagus sp.]HAH36739.1 hypothetical protein [Algoriphagus sp.]HAS58392.1 hypothetical protein [Algoriphagus sp.]